MKIDMKTRTAILRLFKAVLVGNDHLSDAVSPEQSPLYKAVLEKTIAHGYVLDVRVLPEAVTDEMLASINDIVGLSGTQANEAFHKSWDVIKNSTYEQLAIQQMVHYMTTYGFERMGVFDGDSVYVPNEALDVPVIKASANTTAKMSTNATDGVHLQVIRAVTMDELMDKVKVLASGIALATETLDDLMTVISFIFAKAEVDKPAFAQSLTKTMANRELNTRLCDAYDLVPTEPVAFLRHVIFTLTGESLLIKNTNMIEKIKASADTAEGKKALAKVEAMLWQAPENLASIFLRYKPLFLALKSVSKNKTFFNHLRKQAKTQHVALPVDYLNNVTHAIKAGTLDMATLEERLKTATVYRKIRLANALLYRMAVATSGESANAGQSMAKALGAKALNAKVMRQKQDSIVYRVRNGRGWATEFTWHMKHYAMTERAYQAVVSAIAEDVRANVEGKVFYLPANVNYTLPATEKQFTGHFPTGSWVAVPEDLIVGIHWQNAEVDASQAKNPNQSFHGLNKRKGGFEYRVDLDLSLISMSGNKVGWNANYYSSDKGLVFSGDITDAPNPTGATELFYVKKGVKESQALMVNYYNYSAEHAVPCKLIVAHEKAKKFKSNYMVDPNNIVMQTDFHVTERQNMLGLINHVAGENRIYFANMNLGTSIASYGNAHTKHAQQYLLNISENVLMLRDVLQQAGATVVTTREGMAETEVKAEVTSEAKAQTKEKPNNLFTNLISKLMDDVVVSKAKAVEADASEVATDAKAEDVTEVVEAETEKPMVVDLSPSVVNKATFVELLRAG